MIRSILSDTREGDVHRWLKMEEKEEIGEMLTNDGINKIARISIVEEEEKVESFFDSDAPGDDAESERFIAYSARNVCHLLHH